MDDVIFYQNNGISVNDPKNIKTSFYIQENLKQDNFDSRFFTLEIQLIMHWIEYV